MARVDTALASKFDSTVYTDTVNQVEEYSEIIDEVVTELTNKYCNTLDILIGEVKNILENNDEITSDEIDNYILKIPLELYYVSESQESLGIKEDTAKAIRQTIYNAAREKATGTVPDKDAKAEKAVEQETLATIAYARASKKVKHRVEMALELLASLKKVSTRRIEELGVSRYARDDG